MAAIKRSANVVWEGTIARGGGQLSGASGAFAGLPVTAASRFGDPEGKTTPEELIAAAHATCFTMALGGILAGQRTPPEQLAVRAVVTLEEVDGIYMITTSELDVVGRVPGIGADAFERAAREAEQSCPSHARSREVWRFVPTVDSRVAADHRKPHDGTVSCARQVLVMTQES
jgi:lipoyl-dependent peroxiredoxin